MPKHTATGILQQEHAAISAVLHGFMSLARLAQDPKLCPDFQVLSAMLYYIEQWPERLHHPKEEEHLFARLVERAPQAATLVRELRAEHAAGARMLGELARSLAEFERRWPAGAQEFLATAQVYSQFHWDHMCKEEQQLLPLAEQHLAAEDWRAIAEAFAGHHDPIADLREQDFAALFARIVRLAPEPIGLAARWQRVGEPPARSSSGG